MQNGFQALYPTARQYGGGGDVSLTSFAHVSSMLHMLPQAYSLPLFMWHSGLWARQFLSTPKKRMLYSVPSGGKRPNVVVGGKYDFRINYQLGNGSSVGQTFPIMRH